MSVTTPDRRVLTSLYFSVATSARTCSRSTFAASARAWLAGSREGSAVAGDAPSTAPTRRTIATEAAARRGRGRPAESVRRVTEATSAGGDVRDRRRRPAVRGQRDLAALGDGERRGVDVGALVGDREGGRLVGLLDVGRA